MLFKLFSAKFSSTLLFSSVMFSLSRFNERDKTQNSSNEQTNKLDPQKALADKNVTEKAYIFCYYEIKSSQIK